MGIMGFYLFTKGGRRVGVRRLGAFNLSMLGKWCWRMLVDKEGLWYRVLKGKYGEMGGRIREGGRNCSSWWRTVCNVVGVWVRELGVGLTTTLEGWLAMVVILYFGMIIGLGELC